MRLRNKLGIAVVAIMLAIFLQTALADPNGMTTTAGTPTAKGFFPSGTTNATGGLTRNINISTVTQTTAWQGFFGDITGNVTLSDSSGDTLYRWNWSIADGTLFATQASAVNFANISAVNTCSIDQNITGTDSDRVNNTFTASSNSQFIIAGITIAANSACRTNTYINNATQSTRFEEIIVTANGATPIYASKIENNIQGFDGNTHDYQMLVPDSQNSTTTTYYFYAEFK